MDIFFQDPSDIPLPPDEVRIRKIFAEFSSDKKKINLKVEIDPFLVKPNLEIDITNPENGSLIKSTSIIESLTKNVEITIHLRLDEIPPQMDISVELYYLEDQIINDSLNNQENIPDFTPRIIDRKMKRLFIK